MMNIFGKVWLGWARFNVTLDTF